MCLCILLHGCTCGTTKKAESAIGESRTDWTTTKDAGIGESQLLLLFSYWLLILVYRRSRREALHGRGVRSDFQT